MKHRLARGKMLNVLGIDPIEYDHEIAKNLPRFLALIEIQQAVVDLLNIPKYKLGPVAEALYFAAAVGERTKYEGTEGKDIEQQPDSNPL
jgi:hypothetical protein